MEALNQAWFLIINANTQTPDTLIQLAKILAEWVIYLETAERIRKIKGKPEIRG